MPDYETVYEEENADAASEAEPQLELILAMEEGEEGQEEDMDDGEEGENEMDDVLNVCMHLCMSV